jgi:threonine aldolase
MKTVDLRSDTVTQPSPGMRAAMQAAPLGDDVFGDDPSVNALQEKIAGMLGFEAALFVPTGTQGNLCAVLAHCQRGDEYLVGQMQHCYRWEGGGAAVFGSVQPQPIEHESDGTLALERIESAIKPDDPHFARTRLLALENTLGGKRLPMDYLEAATTLARHQGLACHLDGARLFNAAVAQAALNGSDARNEARRIAGCFDSVSVCFSKGLGAPVGSALCGSAELIARARRIRKMAGGGMRQAGVLAAAASYALDHQVDRLVDDHALARRLADGLAGIPGLRVEPPQTNIVFVDLEGTARDRSADLLAHLRAQGIEATGLYRLRFVTHLDVDAPGVDRATHANPHLLPGLRRDGSRIAAAAYGSRRRPSHSLAWIHPRTGLRPSHPRAGANIDPAARSRCGSRMGHLLRARRKTRSVMDH